MIYKGKKIYQIKWGLKPSLRLLWAIKGDYMAKGVKGEDFLLRGNIRRRVRSSRATTEGEDSISRIKLER